MPPPNPTPILRFIHERNLHLYLARGGIHAPSNEPDDGLVYQTNHDVEIQQKRSVRQIPCGPGGVVHDYVPFYFGFLSPMMFQLKTGRVAGYQDGQRPLIYLVSTAQAVSESGAGFVFSDGHGIATFTEWYDDLDNLDKVDWNMVYQRYWTDSSSDGDRQRRKQAEFLVHKRCDWELIQEIVVIDAAMQRRVEEILGEYDAPMRCAVCVNQDWYYH